MSMQYDGTPGEYTYTQGELGKHASGVVAVGAQSSRNQAAQSGAGGADRLPGDHGGHLIAHSLGGANESCNLDAQAAQANQIDQSHVERNISKLASDQQNTVAMDVTNYTSVSSRPDATMINVGVQDNVTGITDEQHISFQNAPHSIQESWNASTDQIASTIDERQDAGMTAEQREAANELCGAEDMVDNSLGSGWSYHDFDESFLDGGPAETASDSEGMAAGESDSEGLGSEDDGLGEF